MKIVSHLFLIIILSFGFSDNLQSQTVILKKINGLSSGQDMANCAFVTSNKEILVAGCTDYGTITMNGVLIKMDSSLNVIWSKRYLTSATNLFYSIIQSYEGGYLLIGNRSSSLMNPYGIYVVNVDSSGNVRWSKTYEGLEAYDVCTSSDHGYVLAGQTTGTGNSTICITKIDSAGNLQWSRTFRGNPGPGESGRSIKRTLDNNYIVTGVTYSFGVLANAIFILKIDSMGNQLWNKTFDSPYPDFAREIILTNDSGFIVLGGIGTMLMKVDKNGNMEWNKEYTIFSGVIQVSAQKFISTADKGFLIYSYFNSGAGLLYKIDSLFHPEWSKEFSTMWGGWGQLLNYNDGYIVAASANYNNGDILIYKSDLSDSDSCTIPWQAIEDSGYAFVVEDVSFIVDTIYNFSSVITATTGFQFTDSLICSEPLMTNVMIDNKADTLEFEIFPNPSSGFIRLTSKTPISKIFINNIYGKRIFQSTYPQELNLSSLPKGIYFLTAEFLNREYSVSRIVLQ